MKNINFLSILEGGDLVYYIVNTVLKQFANMHIHQLSPLGFIFYDYLKERKSIIVLVGEDYSDPFRS